MSDCKNCRECPSCILGLVFPSGCIELSVKGLRDSWRTPRFQQHQSFPFLRIRRCRHRRELLIRNQRKEMSRASLIQRKATNHRQTKEERDDDRSRSPRLRVPEPDPNSTADLLASTTTLAIGVTTMVGALKSSSEKLEILVQNSQNLQQDLCKSLETVSSAVNNMARAIESLSAGVSHNTAPRGCGLWGIHQIEKTFRVGNGCVHGRCSQEERQEPHGARPSSEGADGPTFRINGQATRKHAEDCFED